MFAPGVTLGCEYAGEVIEVGSAVASDLKKGDRIAGLTTPNAALMPNAGTLAEYDAEAAGMKVALGTVFNAFYNLMGLPPPSVDVGLIGSISRGKVTETSERTMLIYGGITTTGLMAIQWATLSSFLVITTCSPANLGLVKERGADHVFEYHDTRGCVEGIRRVSGGQLKLVFDCVGAFDSPQICADAMASDGEGCLYNSLSPTPLPRKDVKSIFTPGQAVLGEAQHMGVQTIPGKLLKAFKIFSRLAEQVFKDGKIHPPPTETLHGIEKILDVVDDSRMWKISGKKMIAQL